MTDLSQPARMRSCSHLTTRASPCWFSLRLMPSGSSFIPEAFPDGGDPALQGGEEGLVVEVLDGLGAPGAAEIELHDLVEGEGPAGLAEVEVVLLLEALPGLELLEHHLQVLGD